MESNSKVKSCETCKVHHVPSPIPFVAHEAMMARMERTIKRLWIFAIILIVLFVVTNAMWLHYEMSFEDTVITSEVQQESEGGGSNNLRIIGGDYIGETESDNNS